MRCVGPSIARCAWHFVARSTIRRMRALAVVVLVLILNESPSAAPASDRLDHFRELARRYAEAPERGVNGSLVSELWRIVDAEVGDNLRSGEPFASTAFIQSRLEAFSDEWG